MLFCLSGWPHKEASTWKYLIEKYPEQIVYQHKLGVSYLKMGSNEKARQVFKDVSIKLLRCSTINCLHESTIQNSCVTLT